MSDTNEITTYSNPTTGELYTPSQYSTFTNADTTVKKMVVNAMNAAESLAQHEGEVLNIVGVFTKPGVRRARDKQGVDTPCTNTTLVSEDGTGYFSQSEGVRNAADTFIAAGLFDDGEVVPMMLVSQQMPNGNTRKTLKLV